MSQVQADVGATAQAEPAVALRRMVMEQGAEASQIRAFLDGLAEPERIAASRGLGPRHQRRLWKLVDGFAELTLADMLPADVPDLTPVPHYGRNTLPLHTLFEKRCYRTVAEDGSPLIAGANFQSLVWLTGPGYYVTSEDTARREVHIDYRGLPGQAPEGWPKIVRNDRGVSRLVYGHMVDICRRVSEHVCIGRATRHGKNMSAWFTLCRPEQP